MRNIAILLLIITTQIFSQSYSPGDHEVLVMPTAYTMPAGSAYFSDYELFVLTFGYAPTSSTHISAGILFPVTTEFYRTFTIGVKQNYFESGHFSGAAFGTASLEQGGYMIGNVFSIGGIDRNFNIGLAYNSEYEGPGYSRFIYMLGSKFDISQTVSLLAEFESSNDKFNFDLTGGIVSLGVRFRDDNITWEIAGFRVINASSESMIFLPFVKVSMIL